jgi:hypothetical protein
MLAWLAAPILYGCSSAAFSDYIVIKVLRDQSSGQFVELGEAISISSACLVGNVFKDTDPHRPTPDVLPDSLIACNHGERQTEFLFEHGCYILKVFSGGGKVRKEVRNGATGICLRLERE